MELGQRRALALSLAVHAGLFASMRLARPKPMPAVTAVGFHGIELVFTASRPMVDARRVDPPQSEPLAASPRRAVALARTVALPSDRAAVGANTAAPARDSVETTLERVVPASRVSGMGLIESMSNDVARIERTSPTRAQGAGESSGEGDVRPTGIQENLRRITDGWREESLRAGAPPRPPGSTEHLRRVTAETARVWNPVRAQDPTIIEGLLDSLLGGVPAFERATRDSLGVFASDRGAAAATELDAVHPHSPTLRPGITLGQAGRATARRFAVELDVVQGADGQLRSIRVARTSGTRWFDAQAESAVREAIARVGPASTSAGGPDGGVRRGWRSRWEFELRLARNPPISLNPGAAGEPSTLANGTMAAGPSVNLLSAGVEWGGVDPPRAQYPFALHRYQRIRQLWVVQADD
jgi:hypothetical protein